MRNLVDEEQVVELEFRRTSVIFQEIHTADLPKVYLFWYTFAVSYYEQIYDEAIGNNGLITIGDRTNLQ